MSGSDELRRDSYGTKTRALIESAIRFTQEAINEEPSVEQYPGVDESRITRLLATRAALLAELEQVSEWERRFPPAEAGTGRIYSLSGKRFRVAINQAPESFGVGDVVVETRDLELQHATYVGIVREVGDRADQVRHIEWLKWPDETFFSWEMRAALTRLVEV